MSTRDEDLQAYIDRIVAQAPPMSEAQIQKIAALLRFGVRRAASSAPDEPTGTAETPGTD